MKKILDACCGSRMFWFDRENQDVLFADNRELETTLSDGRALLVKPDIKMDFREMPFPDNTFKIVVFDPPHLKQAGSESWLAKKYGVLPKDWKPYLKAGFDECMRVLEPDGILVFKWNEEQIKLNDVLKGFGKQRLLKFRNEFQNMTKSALDLDYLGSHYVTLEDYANELNEQFDMGIDVSRVRNCQGSYDETDAKFRTVKLDKVLEELRAGGFEDAAQFLEKKVA